MDHVLSAQQFQPDQLSDIFERADGIRKLHERDRRYLVARHLGQVVATLFYEPSTRTRLSFESAAQLLGAAVISTENAGDFSSAVKGESLEDTIQTVAGYADAIVLRHKETGSAHAAAEVSSVPIINAGDGQGEHPTQALLDLYTIQRELGRTDNLNVVIGGDLVKGRTARSLTKMLNLYPDNEITFVSLPELRISSDITQHLDESGTKYHETEDMSVLRDADVVYWTRLQLERHRLPQSSVIRQLMRRLTLRPASRIDLKHNYVIDKEAVYGMKSDAIIMHPLPRNNEIDPSVDNDPRAKYFEQAHNGLFVRMALLDTLLSR
jgi:aspartate carbamoyltransferase catalytic subunit